MTTTAIDPVCGMTVAAVESSLHLDNEGQHYYFCGPGCLRAFSANPGAFITPTPVPEHPMSGVNMLLAAFAEDPPSVHEQPRSAVV